jgi:hypothetical protein
LDTCRISNILVVFPIRNEKRKSAKNKRKTADFPLSFLIGFSSKKDIKQNNFIEGFEPNASQVYDFFQEGFRAVLSQNSPGF